MKIKLIIACSILAVLAISSCQKCVVCTPHYYAHGVIGAPDSAFASGGTQSVKLCDKVDINSYQNGTNFQDENKDTIRFICK